MIAKPRRIYDIQGTNVIGVLMVLRLGAVVMSSPNGRKKCETSQDFHEQFPVLPSLMKSCGCPKFRRVMTTMSMSRNIHIRLTQELFSPF